MRKRLWLVVISVLIMVFVLFDVAGDYSIGVCRADAGFRVR